MHSLDLDATYMARSLELAAQGEGYVEPNPMVGCLVVQRDQVVGEGWHRRFGGPHAEVEALTVAGANAQGGTLYVTLEPCCHHGKTPPCTDAVIKAGIRRVVVAQTDPFPAVRGSGLSTLRSAGIDVEEGVLREEAKRLTAPYRKLLATGRPWVIAKWAMTLDGKIATHRGDSKWISSEASRSLVHQLRGRVDAILVGRQTAASDDPLLTARPAGPRQAARVVVDMRATLSSSSQLARTARETPLIVAVGSLAAEEDRRRLTAAGAEVLICDASTPLERLDQLLLELGRRRMTNVLVEGGGQLLGSLLDLRQIDEVHAFVAPKLVGGATAIGPMAGQGIGTIAGALSLQDAQWRTVGNDLYLNARLTKDRNKS